MIAKIPISQSLIKQVFKYRRGQYCGLRLKAVYVDKSHREEPTEAMKAGQYFEYRATGQRNYYGEIPQPDRLKSKAPAKAKKAYAAEIKRLKAQRDDYYPEEWHSLNELALEELLQASPLSTAYQHAEKQAEKFREYATAYGWDWDESHTGIKVEKDGMEGFIDLRPYIPQDSVSMPEEWKGELSGGLFLGDLVRPVIDFKYSGLLENRWDPLGWDLEYLHEKREIMVQAVQYHIITGAPFAFFVFSSKTGDLSAKLIPVEVTKAAIKSHLEDVDNTRQIIEQNLRAGFRPLPSIGHCQDCPLKESCSHRADFPLPVKPIKF